MHPRSSLVHLGVKILQHEVFFYLIYEGLHFQLYLWVQAITLYVCALSSNVPT